MEVSRAVMSIDTTKVVTPGKTVRAQCTQLPHAHGVLTCLYEVLLHADGEQAVPYAQATYVAASLINKSAEELDSVRI